MTPRGLSVQDVADRLSLNEKTVRKLVRTGQLRAVRIGRVIRVPESALRELLKETNESAA